MCNIVHIRSNLPWFDRKVKRSYMKLPNQNKVCGFILSNQVMISRKSHCCWIFQASLISLGAAQAERLLIPVYSREGRDFYDWYAAQPKINLDGHKALHARRKVCICDFGGNCPFKHFCVTVPMFFLFCFFFLPHLHLFSILVTHCLPRQEEMIMDYF